MTSTPSHVDVVVLAVFALGGGARPVDTEDIAMKAYELAPSRFSWRKYPDQVNLELVRVSLSDAKKEEKGRRLEGSGTIGWTLTPAGHNWASNSERTVLARDLSRARENGRGGSVDERRWRRERERILASKAWESWARGDGAVAPKDAAEVYRIDSYAVGRMRSLKITRLRTLFADDEEVLPFLTSIAESLEAE